jgi:hypothetical protein
MKTKKRLIPVLLLCFILLTAINCHSDNNDDNLVQGLVIDLGDPSVDGCGWGIKIDIKVFKPLELPVEFQNDSLPVRLQYTLLEDSINCGLLLQQVYPQIKIIKIQKK